MRKKIRYLFMLIVSFGLFTNNVFAASLNVTVTSYTVTVGSSSTLTIKASEMAGKFTVKSSDTSVISLSGSSFWIDNASQTVKMTAKKVGTAKITITPEDVTDYSGKTITGSKTITITVKNKTTSSSNSSGGSSKPAKPKSSNSYLSSLTIEGVELDSKFDKETLEYTATIPAETEKIKINAQLADSSAKVSGTGEVSVSSGLNTFQIVVTAENGSKRTYVLKATVLELEPINVTVNGNEYTVIRKGKELPKISDYYIAKKVKIGENEVDGYYNEKLDYTLVGLKDKTGDVEFYIYNNGKYSLYKEYTFNGMVLQVLDKKVADGLKKTSFSYESDKITSYQEVKLDLIKNTYALDNNEISGNQFYLFYAKNVETGKEQLYQYDAVEKTVQRYNMQVLDMYKDRSDKYYMYLLGSILVIGVLTVTFSTILICKSKKRKR